MRSSNSEHGGTNLLVVEDGVRAGGSLTRPGNQVAIPGYGREPAPVRQLSGVVRPGFDIDGVLADSSKYVIEKLGLDPDANKTWDWALSYSKTVDIAATDIYRSPEIWVAVEPMPRAAEALDAIQGWGILPVFISSFGSRFYGLRAWWLQDRFGLYPFSYQLFRASGEAKAALALELGLTHFVEDKATTANAMVEAGIKSYLVESNYRDDTPHHPDVILVADVMEYVQEVLKDANV